MPDLIEKDFQSIYFGTPAHDDLIQAIARMGLSRDRRAPTELTDAQKDELRESPELIKLREKRDRCTAKIRRCLKPAAETDLKRQRERLTAKIHTRLPNCTENASIKPFENSQWNRRDRDRKAAEGYQIKRDPEADRSIRNP